MGKNTCIKMHEKSISNKLHDEFGTLENVRNVYFIMFRVCKAKTENNR